MHSLSESSDGVTLEPLQVICHLTTFIVEGRLPPHRLRSSIDFSEIKGRKPRPYYEGFHCPILVGGLPREGNHRCQERSSLCIRYHKLINLLEKLGTSIAVETYLASDCHCAKLRSESTLFSTPAKPEDVLLEQWTFSITDCVRSQPKLIALGVLYQALRSSLHFSQMSAWYVQNNGEKPAHIVYRVCHLRDAAQPRNLLERHIFPVAEVNRNILINVVVSTLPRTEQIPTPKCFAHSRDGKIQNNLGDKYRSHIFPFPYGFTIHDNFKHSIGTDKMRKVKCLPAIEKASIWDTITMGNGSMKSVKEYSSTIETPQISFGMALVDHVSPKCFPRKLQRKFNEGKDWDIPTVLDGRIDIKCDILGKHHCKHFLDEDEEQASDDFERYQARRALSGSRVMGTEDVERVGRSNTGFLKRIFNGKFKDIGHGSESPDICANEVTISTSSEFNQSIMPSPRNDHCKTIINLSHAEKPQFHFDNVAQIVDVSKPKLDANPFLAAILRCTATNDRLSGICDASTNTDISVPPNAVYIVKHVHKKTSIDLWKDFSLSSGKVNRTTSTEERCSGATISPLNGMSFNSNCFKSHPLHSNGHGCFLEVPVLGSQISGGRKYHSLPLLGSFEESALRGRLEPLSTVEGFTAELGASGSFFPPHVQLPVTVSFLPTQERYDGNAPYLGHMSLDKKGYNVPRSGTIQVTLFNPQKTVVNMFVVKYDLEDMPPKTCTFLRQRTFYVPANLASTIQYTERSFRQIPTKYLIHLRFNSGKTGKIYLHSDVRFLISSKADVDAASVIRLRGEPQILYKLYTHTMSPTNPKYSAHSR